MSASGPDFAKTLAALAYAGTTKPEVIGLWYHQQKVVLDGYRFVRCRFDSCELHVNSNEFELDQCMVSDDTLVVYGANVHRIVQFFVYRAGRPVWEAYPQLDVTHNSDGTITLK